MPNHAIASETITFTMRVFQRVLFEKSNPWLIGDDFLPVFIEESSRLPMLVTDLSACNFTLNKGRDKP